LMYNPDVTLRMRGIVEKCTFCIQRINSAKHDAVDNNNGKIFDGSLQTACQQACPTNAIIFGDLNDSESKVAQLSSSNRAFCLLDSLNTKPSVFYLRKI